jgi:UDP-N-acetylmuramoylalanine--D-glutamate ligase
MLEVVEDFRGVPHRLELVRELRGVRWYNGSIATAPERSMADINTFNEPIVLMLGGRDKDLPWDEIAKLIHKRVDHVVLFGEAAELIQKAVSTVGGERSVDIRRANNFQEAVAIAAEIATSGDIVLLSPGGTSYDEFKDFAERGETFRKWVLELS